MRVLVTRPYDDALETAAKLKARGHESIIAPLLEIRFRDGEEIALEGVQAILVTSANGVRALARRTTRRDVPLFAVGRQSAEVARAAGFADVRSADGDGAALARAAMRWASRDGGVLLHVAGRETKGELSATLEKEGFVLRALTLYDAVAAEILPEVAALALRARALDVALFFSPRSARIFRDLVRSAGLAESCRGALAVAISDAAAKELFELGFGAVRVASHPDQDALLTLLDEAASCWKSPPRL
jgi:uroporphyrinogen-III synthase